MSLVDELHQAHRARLAKFDAAAARLAKRKLDAAEALARKQIEKERADKLKFQAWKQEQIARCDRNKGLIEIIQTKVARQYNITRGDILSPRRLRYITTPRFIAVYLSRKLTNKSFPELGRRFGGRNHKSIFHAIQRVAGLIEQSPEFAEVVDRLESEIRKQVVRLGSAGVVHSEQSSKPVTATPRPLQAPIAGTHVD